MYLSLSLVIVCNLVILLLSLIIIVIKSCEHSFEWQTWVLVPEKDECV